MRMVAEYLASVNLSKETWSYPLKTLPRLTGRSNRFVLTEYALPQSIIQPHDVVLRRTGAWSGSRISPSNTSARWTRRPARSWEYPIPVLKAGYPVGTLDLGLDKAGNPWIGMMLPERHRALRQEDRDVQDLVDPEGMADRRARRLAISIRPSRTSTARSG